MNGAELPAAHGFPLRAVVGGWFGMAAVKWLSRVVVTDRPFQGFWQSLDYTYFERRHGLPSVTPITSMLVKSSISRPFADEVVAKGRTYAVTGAAWAGESDIAKVELSTDGGGTWQPAKLLGEAVPFAWRLWSFDWRVPDQPGRVSLVVRATDTRGATQPTGRDADRRTYMVNHLVPVEVRVE
jgi:DMSO/TMAO reductase YedYZ molybdopterin-dependent catalytic subunit